MKLFTLGFLIISSITVFSQVDYDQLLFEAESIQQEDPTRSIELIDQILQADSIDVSFTTRINALQLKGLIRMYNYQFDASDQYFLRAYHLLNSVESPEAEAVRGKVLFNLGRNLIYQSQYDSALQLMIEAKNASETIDDQEVVAQVLNAIAIIYIQYSNDAEKALNAFQNALKIHLNDDDSAQASRVMQNIGQIHNMTGQNDSALYYLRISNRMVEEMKDFRSLAVGTNILGAVFYDLSLLDSSEVYFRKAIQLDLMNQDSIGLIQDYSQLGNTLLAANKMSEAIRYSQLAFNNTKDLYLKAETAEILSRIYEGTGEYLESLAYFKTFKLLTDSMQREDQRNTVSELQTKYETAEKEKEIELANAELERKERFQQFLIIIIVIILVFSALAIFLLIQRFKLRRALLSQEIDTLRAQINSIFKGGISNLDLSIDQINEGLYKPLSEREYEILTLAVSDQTNSEIADTVFVSVNTVKTHLKNIYSKLGVSNRKEALEVLLAKS